MKQFYNLIHGRKYNTRYLNSIDPLLAKVKDIGYLFLSHIYMNLAILVLSS